MSKRAYDKGTQPDVCEVVVSDVDAVAAVRAEAPSEKRLAAAADVFAALGDPTRLRILLALACRELCVCDLVALTGISQSGVSHQLRVLRDLRLVAFRRDGKRAVYRLADDHVRTLLEQGVAHAAEREEGNRP